jgi:hypothetical protein
VRKVTHSIEVGIEVGSANDRANRTRKDVIEVLEREVEMLRNPD